MHALYLVKNATQPDIGPDGVKQNGNLDNKHKCT